MSAAEETTTIRLGAGGGGAGGGGGGASFNGFSSAVVLSSPDKLADKVSPSEEFRSAESPPSPAHCHPSPHPRVMCTRGAGSQLLPESRLRLKELMVLCSFYNEEATQLFP